MQADTLQQARQGNPQAIAALINRQLQPRNIYCRVAVEEGCLKILLESAIVPDQPSYAAYILRGVKKLGVRIERLQVFGRESGKVSPVWMEEFELTEPQTEEVPPEPKKPVQTVKARVQPNAKVKPANHSARPIAQVKPKSKSKKPWFYWLSLSARLTIVSAPVLAVLIFFSTTVSNFVNGNGAGEILKESPQVNRPETKLSTTKLPETKLSTTKLPETKALELEYPSSWNQTLHAGISQALAKNAISACTQFRWKQNNKRSDEYLVQCSKNGKSWLTYNVWPEINKVLYVPRS